MVKTLENAGPEETQRFEKLLSRIAAYHDEQPPVAQTPALGGLQALDQHLKSYGRRWPKENSEGKTEHWSPMVGGDVGAGRSDS